MWLLRKYLDLTEVVYYFTSVYDVNDARSSKGLISRAFSDCVEYF